MTYLRSMRTLPHDQDLVPWANDLSSTFPPSGLTPATAVARAYLL